MSEKKKTTFGTWVALILIVAFGISLLMSPDAMRPPPTNEQIWAEARKIEQAKQDAATYKAIQMLPR